MHLLQKYLHHNRRHRIPNLPPHVPLTKPMLERKAIETSELSTREAALAGRMAAQTAAAGNGVLKRFIARVRRFIDSSGCGLRAVVWEVVGDAADGVVYGGVRRSVGEAVDVLGLAVGRLGKVRERLARARCPVSIRSKEN